MNGPDEYTAPVPENQSRAKESGQASAIKIESDRLHGPEQHQTHKKQSHDAPRQEALEHTFISKYMVRASD